VNGDNINKFSGRDLYLMNQGEFVRGKRLIDPVTGRLERDHDEEDEDKSEDSFESIE
jgi:hypothetical protein